MQIKEKNIFIYSHLLFFKKDEYTFLFKNLFSYYYLIKMYRMIDYLICDLTKRLD